MSFVIVNPFKLTTSYLVKYSGFYFGKVNHFICIFSLNSLENRGWSQGWVLMVYWEVQSWDSERGEEGNAGLCSLPPERWRLCHSGQLQTGYPENKYRIVCCREEGRWIYLPIPSHLIALVGQYLLYGELTLCCPDCITSPLWLLLQKPDPTMWDAILGNIHWSQW